MAADPTSVRLGIEAKDQERPPVLRDSARTERARAIVDAWLGDAPPSEINALRVEVAELRAEVARLRARLDELSAQ